MDPVIYMVLIALSGMALTLGVSWVVGKLFRR
jgi:hypothetical protein